jgi:hypothetical protein
MLCIFELKPEDQKNFPEKGKYMCKVPEAGGNLDI